MSEYVTVWRATVAEGDVEALLDVEPKAIAEAKRLCPEMLGAELVNLGDGTWLHVLRWSAADGEEKLMARADDFEVIHTMHRYLAEAGHLERGEVERGEIVSRS